MTEHRLTFPRQYIIKKQTEFTAFFSHSRRVENKFVRVYIAKAAEIPGRFAFVTGKKLGKAVFRNHCRRRLKEVCRVMQDQIDRKMDYVLVAKRPTMSISFETACTDLIKLLKC